MCFQIRFMYYTYVQSNKSLFTLREIYTYVLRITKNEIVDN